MFKKGRLKKVLTTTMVLALVLSSVAVAANDIYEKNIKATYGRIKFVVDGKDVTQTIEEKYEAPAFVVEGRSYAPIRAIAELMGLQIEYDTNTHTAEIIDAKSQEYEKEITKKNEEIKKKDAEIAKLKKELEGKKEPVKEPEKKVTDIEKLEKDLNKDYGKYKNVDFSIKLKETNSKVDVSIYVDFSSGRQEAYWNAMSYSNRKTFVEDIASDVSSVFSDFNLTGSIYDNYYRSNLLTFSKNRNSNVVISYKGSPSPSYDYDYGYGYGVDYVVRDEFEYRGIYDAYASRVSYGRYEASMDISFSSRYNDEWDGLSESTISSMLDKVADEMDYDYYDDYYNDYYYNDIRIEVKIGSAKEGYYTRSSNSRYGTFRFY